MGYFSRIRFVAAWRKVGRMAELVDLPVGRQARTTR